VTRKECKRKPTRPGKKKQSQAEGKSSHVKKTKKETRREEGGDSERPVCEGGRRRRYTENAKIDPIVQRATAKKKFMPQKIRASKRRGSFTFTINWRSRIEKTNQEKGRVGKGRLDAAIEGPRAVENERGGRHRGTTIRYMEKERNNPNIVGMMNRFTAIHHQRGGVRFENKGEMGIETRCDNGDSQGWEKWTSAGGVKTRGDLVVT